MIYMRFKRPHVKSHIWLSAVCMMTFEIKYNAFWRMSGSYKRWQRRNRRKKLIDVVEIARKKPTGVKQLSWPS